MGSIQNDDKKELTILVTGFGPFQEKFPVNPSFEITRLLPDYLPATSPHQSAVRIISYGSPVRVAYDEVRALVPQLHDEYSGTVDLVLHIGMASGRKFYCAERYGHRDGYIKNKDLDGKMPPPDEGKTIFGDCPATMTTSLDFDSLVMNWQVNIMGIPEGQPGADSDARASEDAGRYLCDYIYFNSLAYFGRRNGEMEVGKPASRPVLFLHVPAESDEAMLQRGRAVAIALIRAMADNHARRQEGQLGVV